MNRVFNIREKGYRILSKCALRENTNEREILRRAIALYELLSDKYSSNTKDILIAKPDGEHVLTIQFDWEGDD